MTDTERRTDVDLKAAVTDELDWTPAVDSTHIGISVNHGAVTLSGEVESYPEKHLAERAVLRVRGVTAVAQDITVRSTWGAANDTDIARDTSAALASAVDVPAGLVHGAVHDHVITLSGVVGWQYQREAAGRAVRYLKGVTDVQNSITIRPTVSATGVKTAIAAALVRNAKYEGRHITVTSDDAGTVTLAGDVQSWSESSEAEHMAWSAPGVSAVINNVRVQNL